MVKARTTNTQGEIDIELVSWGADQIGHVSAGGGGGVGKVTWATIISFHSCQSNTATPKLFSVLRHGRAYQEGRARPAARPEEPDRVRSHHSQTV